MSRTLCLDSSVLVKLVVPESGSTQARDLAVSADKLVAPAFAWAEVGSALLKQVRMGLVTLDEAERAWTLLLALNVQYRDDAEIRREAWRLASLYDLPTLYDAAFLAVANLEEGDGCDFWSADRSLLARLDGRHPRAHLLDPDVE